MFDKISRWAMSIDWRRVRDSLLIVAIVLGLDLLVFWWNRASWWERLGGLAYAGAAFAGAHWVPLFKIFGGRRERRGGRAGAHSPRPMPPGPQLIEEVYSALLNLGYQDDEVRGALWGLRARDLKDFDTAFRAAMAQLRDPARTI